MKKVLRVDPGVMVEQRWNNWPDLHPEDYCHRCGCRNLHAWSVDSRFWNLAVEALGLSIGAILCPQCFYEGFELVVGQTWWTLVPGEGTEDVYALVDAEAVHRGVPVYRVSVEPKTPGGES